MKTHYWNIVVGRHSLCLLNGGEQFAAGRTGLRQYLQNCSDDQCSGIVSEVQMRRFPSLFKPQIPTDQLAPPSGTRPVHQCDVKFLAERTAVGQGDRVTLRI